MRKFTVLLAAVASIGFSGLAMASIRPVNADQASINPNSPVYTGSVAAEALTVVPVGVESSAESGISTIIRQLPRSYQEYIDASNLSSITESVNITGMQLRMAIGENWRTAGYVGSSWPNAPISFNNYDVKLGTPSAQMLTDGEYLTGTEVYANFMTDATTVRSGPWSIAAGAFPADGGPTGIHSWGPLMNFTTPYLYNPGEGLMVQVNHDGYGTTVLQSFFASRNYANGVTDAISNSASGAYTSTAANGFSSPYFIQFTYSAVPEPTTLGALALFGTLALRRRK